LTTRIDIPAQSFHGIAHCRDNARVIVGHDSDNVSVFEAGDHGLLFFHKKAIS
jgi:hypothetical protein